jgi:hypothetical protein
MSKTTRLAFLGVAVVILVVAFLVLRPSSDDPETTADAPTATPTATITTTPAAGETGTPTPTETPTPEPTVDPGPLLTGSKVVKLRFDKGDTVRFRVRAPQDEEVHIHGYDIKKDVKAGVITNISFEGSIDGIFEIEFEDQGKQIAELRVDP